MKSRKAAKKSFKDIRSLKSSLDCHRHGVSAAQAQRCDSAMGVATPQFIKHRRQNSRSGLPDRMSERDGASIHIQLLRIEIYFARDCNSLHSKRFIQFDQIDVV